MGILTEEDRPLMEALLNYKDDLTTERNRARREVDRLIGMRDLVASQEDSKRLEREIVRVRAIERNLTKEVMKLTVKKIAAKFEEDDGGIGVSQVKYHKRKELHV